MTCLPCPVKNTNFKEGGKLTFHDKFQNSSKEIVERGKFVDQKKFEKSDIFFSKSNSIGPKIRERAYKANQESDRTEKENVRRRSTRPEFIKNPFESQIGSFH